MIKLLKLLLLPILCNIFLLSSCCKEEDIVYARININGEYYEDFETKNCLYTPSGPMIFPWSECENQLFELTLLLSAKASKNRDCALHVYFDAPLGKLQTKEAFSIVTTVDTLLFKDKPLKFLDKTWRDRKELPTFGSGGVSILLTADMNEKTNDIASLSGTCIINSVDSKGIANGYLKLSGVSYGGKEYNLYGSFTAYVGTDYI